VIRSSALAATDAADASALALANGWERRLERARDAFSRPTEILSATGSASAP